MYVFDLMSMGHDKKVSLLLLRETDAINLPELSIMHNSLDH